MRVLVTGATGFVGRHLVTELSRSGHEPLLLDSRPPPDPICHTFVRVDITQPDALADALRRHSPEACIHLAGIAFVPLGWREPATVIRVNLMGTVALLEALRENTPHCRTLIVTSAEIYGRRDPGRPLAEEAPVRPENPYAVSKAGADMAALLFAGRYGLPIMTARPANHCGPGQSSAFVVPAFARQLAEIRLGRRPPQMLVGNLESLRTFTDVRDVVRAYRLLVEKGRPGTAYNISASNRVKIREMLESLMVVAGVRPQLVTDPNRYRPTDSTPLLDVSRLQADTGWSPRYSLEETLHDVFEYELRQLQS